MSVLNKFCLKAKCSDLCTSIYIRRKSTSEASAKQVPRYGFGEDPALRLLEDRIKFLGVSIESH